jgi:hypothetical protein
MRAIYPYFPVKMWVAQASDPLVCLRWMVRSFENDVQAVRGCAGITLRRVAFCAERIHIGGKPQVVLGPQESEWF